MRICNMRLHDFEQSMRSKKVYCFGCGRMLKTFIDKCPIESSIIGIIDNDESKHCPFIKLRDKSIKILSFDEAVPMLNQEVIVVITANVYNGFQIYKQLSSANIHADVYWSLFLLSDVAVWKQHLDTTHFELKLNTVRQIPKIIHYCWFGDKEIPAEHQRYIEGWHNLCPDYEIIKWSEDNYDIKKNRYMYEAYQAKAWGFVPDYIRKDLIYEYGGIYLDTDVEMIKRPDELLYQKGFCGFEGNRVAFGLGFGAIKGLPILAEMRDEYNNLTFSYDKRENMKIGPDYETEILERYGLVHNGKYQQVADLTVYPEFILSGSDIWTGESRIADKTIFVHHYAGSWIDEDYRRLQNNIRSLYKNIAINEQKETYKE